MVAAVRDRQALVSTLRGLLGDLGLKRRTREAPTLSDYLRQRSTPTPNGQAAPLSDADTTAEGMGSPEGETVPGSDGNTAP